MITRAVAISSGKSTILGDLQIPDDPCGIVLFAHGSGSGRLSRRNRTVAESLNRDGLATLLIDLLTEEEEEIERYSHSLRFDIDLLAERLQSASTFLQEDLDTARLPLGYFGASTGAAAALVATARSGNSVKAVVSRGGRPDLARAALSKVTAPTLLLVGSLDTVVIDLNELALSALQCEKRMVIISGATHLFEEPGKLEEVSRLAGDWFRKYLCEKIMHPKA